MNKLSDYYESKDMNAMIPIAYQQHKSSAIVYGGTRVSIITKQSLEAWEQTKFETSTLVVKLVDGIIAKLVSIVQDVRIMTFHIDLPRFAGLHRLIGVGLHRKR